MGTIETEIGNVLAQIRAVSNELGTARADTPTIRGESGGPQFGDLIKQALDAVNEQQHAADTVAQRFQAGDPTASIAEVVVEMQKASLSFQAMTEARNRIVEAYREIMSMSV